MIMIADISDYLESVVHEVESSFHNLLISLHGIAHYEQ